MTGPAYVIPQAEIDERVAARVGGKALALARMSRAGIAVPPFVAVTTDAYEAYLEADRAARRASSSSSSARTSPRCAGRSSGTRPCASAACF